MIISNNFIWIHNPKTAGTSLHNVFLNRHGLDCFRELHATYRDVPIQDREGKFVFGFMRNPIDQEVSLWKYHADFAWKKESGKPPMCFEDWCRWRYVENEEFATPWLNETQRTYGHVFNIRPQAGYFCDENGACKASKIYRFEKLHGSLEEVSERIGLDVRINREEKDCKGMTYGWSRGKDDYSKYVTPYSEKILRKAKAIDFFLYEQPGDINLNFEYETVPNYAYSR